MYRAWFINDIRYKFSKDFSTACEMDEFIKRAAKVGVKLIAFVSI